MEKTRAQRIREKREKHGIFEYTTSGGDEYTLKKPSTIRLTKIMEGLGILDMKKEEIDELQKSEDGDRKMKLGLEVYAKITEVANEHLPMLSIDPKILPMDTEVTNEDEISLDELDEDEVLEIMIALTKEAGGKEGQEKAKKFLKHTAGEGGSPSGEDIFDTSVGDTPRVEPR